MNNIQTFGELKKIDHYPMKVFFTLFLLFAFMMSKGQKKASIYLSHCDSLFYLEGENFDPQKIKRGKMKDSTFINSLFSNISPSTHKILFKPYTDICIDGGGMIAAIQPWKTFLTRKGFDYVAAPTSSAEDKYFGEQSIYAYVKESQEERKSSKNNIPPPPPPPPAPIVTKDGKPVPGADPYSFFVKASDVVTFLLNKNDGIYYYEGLLAGNLHKTDLNNTESLIKKYKGKIKARDLFFFIKIPKGYTSQNLSGIRAQMHANDIMPGHYIITDITTKEIKSINNYKEN